MSSRILTGDVFDMLPTIAPGSVDCVVTSPPYWCLRSYLPKDHPLKPKELGSEKTPGEFVARMVDVFRLVRDTMADHATCWLNMGDSYSGSSKGHRDGQGKVNGKGANRNGAFAPDIDSGNLCLIPQRLAIALQDDGWLVRSIVIWHKPAPMPASVAGWRWMRCRVKQKAQMARSSEINGRMPDLSSAHFDHRIPGPAQWSDCPGCAKCRPNGGLVLRRGSWRPTSSYEPILMLAKRPGYYADGEAVRTAAKSATISRDKYTRIAADGSKCFVADDDTGGAAVRLGREDREPYAVQHDHETESGAGANLRDVWTIAAEPLKNEKVRIPVYVGVDEATDGMERIRSRDCPIHGDHPVSSVSCDGHSGDESSRTQHTDARPGQAQLAEPDPTQDQSSVASVLSRTDGRAAKGRSKGKSKKRHGSPTSLEGNASEETSSRTDRTSFQSECDRQHHGMSENNTEAGCVSGDSRSDPLEQTSSGKSGISKSSCTCSFKKWIIKETAHYASFPTELVRLCLKAGTSEKGYCRECGKPWARVVEKAPVGTWHDHDAVGEQYGSRMNGRGPRANDGRPSEADHEYDPGKTIGWRPTCTCPPNEPRPALVLDPFAGSGRTGVCAQRMFLDFIGVELNEEYARMSERILRDDCPLFSTNGEP